MKKRKSNKKFLKTIIILAIIIVAIYLLLILLPSVAKSSMNNVAIVKIKGPIGTTVSPLSLTSSVKADDIIGLLEKAERDPTVKGIILEIDSPGGTVVTSKEISEKVKSIEKPVVAWIREVGASGAYWIASSSDSIVADPMSITGSIGVISGYLEFSEFLNNYGIKYEEIRGGEYKGLGSPFKELNKQERAIFQDKIDLIHKHFTKTVMENRNLDSDDFADGLFYLGIEAKELGLVDHLGGKSLAINITKDLAGIDQAKLVIYEKEKSLIERLATVLENSFFKIGQGIGSIFLTTQMTPLA